MADARKQPTVERRTIRGDSPSQRPPPVSARPASVASSSPPPVVEAFDEAPTVARGTPALPEPSAPAARSDHATLLGVAPPGADAPAAVLSGPVFVAGALPVLGPAPAREPARSVTAMPARTTPWRAVLLALGFVAVVIVALVVAKAALDARARAHTVHREGAGLDLRPQR